MALERLSLDALKQWRSVLFSGDAGAADTIQLDKLKTKTGEVNMRGSKAEIIAQLDQAISAKAGEVK